MQQKIQEFLPNQTTFVQKEPCSSIDTQRWGQQAMSCPTWHTHIKNSARSYEEASMERAKRKSESQKSGTMCYSICTPLSPMWKEPLTLDWVNEPSLHTLQHRRAYVMV